jgi:hypothetical protein
MTPQFWHVQTTHATFYIDGRAVFVLPVAQYATLIADLTVAHLDHLRKAKDLPE